MKAKIKEFDKTIFGLGVILSVIGLIVISSASSVLSYQRFGHTNYYLTRQVIFFVIGVALALIVSRIDYRIFKKYAFIILAIVFVLLVIVLIPSVGFSVGGSRRWIDLGVFFFQPTEFAKLAIIFYLSAWFSTREEIIHSFYGALLPPILVSGALAALILMEPDFGTMSALGLIVLAIFFASGAKLSHLFALILSGVGLAWLAISAAPYRVARITSFLDPAIDPQGIGYQINQALIAIGSGGFFGQGFGFSRQKFNFLPEPIGDSIFAVMSEELGFVRVGFVLLLFLVFGIFGYRIAKKAPDSFGTLVAIGITSWIVFQTVLNVGAMVGLLPLTGIPLPFISYGGSSMLATMIALGVLLNISRQRL